MHIRPPCRHEGGHCWHATLRPKKKEDYRQYTEWLILTPKLGNHRQAITKSLLQLYRKYDFMVPKGGGRGVLIPEYVVKKCEWTLLSWCCGCEVVEFRQDFDIYYRWKFCGVFHSIVLWSDHIIYCYCYWGCVWQDRPAQYRVHACVWDQYSSRLNDVVFTSCCESLPKYSAALWGFGSSPVVVFRTKRINNCVFCFLL
jgi:hypothetical protein